MTSHNPLSVSLLVLVGLAALPHAWAAEASPPTTREIPAAALPSPRSPVADLQNRLQHGDTQLQYDRRFGYLLGVLEALKVPQSSQLLVFSKTSCQRERISPRTPRAIYFHDRVYVAWVPGAPLLEISAADPTTGPVFYTVDQRESAPARLTRRDQCLECHTSRQTLGLPGYIVRSYGTDTNGVIDFTDGSSMVDHRTPFPQRWGGWYLCGTTGPAHRGTAFDPWPKPSGAVSPPDTIPVMPELGLYPQATSDPVALLVLQHQAQMQNLITRLHHSGEAGPDRALLDQFVNYLLFTEEAEWIGPIQATPAFASWFENQGPRDHQGRSLRAFDLHNRLFKFPCSYMIYSDSFDALPRATQLQVYRRLWRILHGEDSDPRNARMSAEGRRAVLEILLETKADLPVDWKL